MLERREVFSANPIGSMIGHNLLGKPGSPVGEQAVMIVPSGESPVHFFLDSRSTPADDELGYFFTDGPDGRITKRADNDPDGAPLLDRRGRPQYVRPGDREYAKYALAANNSVTVFASGEVANHEAADKTLYVRGDHYFGFYVIQNAGIDDWRQSRWDQRPNVWFSIRAANGDSQEHFRLTEPGSPAYRENVQQYQVEDGRVAKSKSAGRHRADYDDLVFSVNIVPFAYESDYTVYNSGANFDGPPQAFQVDTPGDFVNRGLGFLYPNRSFNRNALTVTDVRLYTDDAEWQPVGDPQTHTGSTTLDDDYLHGVLTVYPNGGLAFEPDPDDPYWYIQEQDSEPSPIYFEYRISDDVDTTENYVGIGHGTYQRGGPIDDQHAGQPMYLLAGGGDGELFDAARSRFFTEGSQGQDIVLISQGLENREFADYVFDYYADGTARSVTALNITTREQADDPRLAQIIDGAEVIWFGGGAQSIYQNTWRGTLLFDALARAAASDVAIGGTSAGMAILGQLAYVELPWDSVQSSFATLEPLDPRINLESSRLPFAALSNSPAAPLFNLVTDTHFASRDRMGRLITFTARAGQKPLNGIGMDESTAVLIEKSGDDWLWNVAGEGHAYLISPGIGVQRARYEDGSRLTYSRVNVLRLDSGTSQTISQLQAATPTYHITVSAGTVFTTENGGQLY